jgi:TolB-like protein
MSLLTELKRRNVFRVAVAYAVIAWVLAQVADLAFDNFGTPEWVGKTVLFILVLGFPLAVFFAWAYELTPEGVKRESEVDRSRSITQVTAHKLDRAIIVVLMVAVAFFAYDKFVPSSAQEDDPMHVAAPASAEHASVEPALAAESNSSIAVLPFVNMSDDAANEYFSDGLSEEILNLLTKVPGLKVIARTSSFAFKGKNQDLREVGEALGVRHVLEGSVRKSGERIRITAQLIDVSDGSHIWSETFDRTMTDIFEIQDEVAASIVDTLRIHVANEPGRGRPTESTQAYELFLQAKAARNWTDNIVDYLQAAIALDPDFAEAWELLAMTYWSMAGTSVKSNEGQRLTFEAARRALDLDPELVMARALYRSADLDAYSWLGEIEAFEQVLREQPGNTDALDALVFDLIEAGYVQEALPYAERLFALDPLSPLSKSRYYQALVAAGRHDEVTRLMENDVSMPDGFRMLQGNLLLFDGQVDQATYWYERSLKNWFADVTWVKSAVENGRDTEGGQDYLDTLIVEQLSTLPEDQRFDAWRFMVNWYPVFGHLDRYYEIIESLDLMSSTWTDADWQVYVATAERNHTGFTAHPKYLQVAASIGLTGLWDQRGAPDFCTKEDGVWICD